MKAGKFAGPMLGKITYDRGTESELDVVHYLSEEMHEVMLTHWYPDEDDIRRMIDGHPIALHIVGRRHPYVKVEVPET